MADQPRFLRALIDKGVLPNGDISLHPCGGGDTHRSFKAVSEANAATWFIKVNSGAPAGVLATEFESLLHLARLLPGVYPEPIYLLEDQGQSALVMEFLTLQSLQRHQYEQLGQLMAQHHQVKAEHFGWPSDNHIGLTPQLNQRSDSWAEFYWQQRLMPQLQWAAARGLSEVISRQLLDLQSRIEAELMATQIGPRLLHGDLWGGNVGFDSSRQQAVVFDPAPYFGDPEVDLAMTHLFGAFPREFYQAYDQSGLRRDGHERRRPIYELYHALNHFNLFGATYSTLVNEKANLIGQVIR